MTKEEGKGFARRITESNLGDFAPLLGDRKKKADQTLLEGEGSTETTADAGNDDLTTAQGLFAGSKVVVKLPFGFPPGTFGQTERKAATPVQSVTSGVQATGSPHHGLAVLVAEIPGPGRWSQAAFSKEVFSDFFGAQWIDLTHMNANGTATQAPRVDPIVKQSSNYCYELSAASGRPYPDPASGRPICVFLRLDVHRFEYRLVMPSDPDHATLDTFLATYCARTSPQRMRRLITDLGVLVSAWPAAPFTLTTSGSQGVSRD